MTTPLGCLISYEISLLLLDTTGEENLKAQHKALNKLGCIPMLGCEDPPEVRAYRARSVQLLVDEFESVEGIDTYYLRRMASDYFDAGDYKSALQCAESMVKLAQKAGNEWDTQITWALFWARICYKKIGLIRQALELCKQQLFLVLQTKGLSSPDVAEMLLNVSWTYFNLGCLPEAEDYARRAIPLFERTYRSPHIRVPGAMEELASIQIHMKAWRRAETTCIRSLRRLAEMDPPHEAGQSAMLNLLAEVYENTGREEEAHRCKEEARLVEQKVGINNEPTMKRYFVP